MLEQQKQGGSAVSQGSQQTELKSRNCVVADLTLLPGNASRATLPEPPAPSPFYLVHTLKVGGQGETTALQTWI